MEKGYFGKLFFYEDGTVTNGAGNSYPINEDKKGNLTVFIPEFKRYYRLDYVIASLFLNDCKEIVENHPDYFIEHLDENFKNCRVDNLKILTGEEAREKKFAYLISHKKRC